MKKLIFGGLFLGLVAISFVGCKKDVITKEDSQIAKFERYGNLHNSYMTNTYSNFNTSKYYNYSPDEKLNQLYQFNIAYTNTLSELNITEKELFNKALSENKSLFILSNAKQNLSEFHLKSGDLDNNINSLIDYSEDKNLMSSKTIEFLKEMTKIAQNSLFNNMKDSDLDKAINQLINDFNKGKFKNTTKEEQELIGIILSISKSSSDWWKENPDARADGEYEPNAVAPWVGADIGGAIYGSVMGAAGSYVNTGSVSWGAVGWGAVSGAVGTSTGIGGKIWKWLH